MLRFTQHTVNFLFSENKNESTLKFFYQATYEEAGERFLIELRCVFKTKSCCDFFNDWNFLDVIVSGMLKQLS